MLRKHHQVLQNTFSKLDACPYPSLLPPLLELRSCIDPLNIIHNIAYIFHRIKCLNYESQEIINFVYCAVFVQFTFIAYEDYEQFKHCSWKYMFMISQIQWRCQRGMVDVPTSKWKEIVVKCWFFLMLYFLSTTFPKIVINKFNYFIESSSKASKLLSIIS